MNTELFQVSLTVNVASRSAEHAMEHVRWVLERGSFKSTAMTCVRFQQAAQSAFGLHARKPVADVGTGIDRAMGWK